MKREMKAEEGEDGMGEKGVESSVKRELSSITR